MRKIRLSLDALRVESFEAGGAGRTGTVHAHDTLGGCGGLSNAPPTCIESCTCPIPSVCDFSCDESCASPC